ncbi:reverse transcriptase family protein [Variovorax paradoxus]|uniref:reverse transcriptase family protein n=1 Tax=Variovorax paradoxus TaxID=34073 RepID=UPI0012BD7DFE|nr:reverse transcriptase family protein [Variovorax paradoxus]
MKSYALNQCPLFKMASRRKLASLLGFDAGVLQTLANRTTNYLCFDIAQGSKKRRVEVPKRALERVHRRLFALLERIEKPDYLHSGRKKRSYITNAQVHTGLAPLVKLDLKKFYPSVASSRIYRFFNEVLLCSCDVAAILTKLCTVDGHLPTGSCISQLLAFFAAKPMFDELHEYSFKLGNRDSCYVDDLTWSGSNATPAFLWAAKQIVHRHGFKYHKDLVYRADQQKVVTGVLISGGELTVQRSREHELWRSIHALGGQDPAKRLKAIDSLIGKVIANGQIENRFLLRVQGLRARRVMLMGSRAEVVSSLQRG